MVTNGYLYYQAYNYVQDYLIYYGIIVLDLIILLVLLMSLINSYSYDMDIIKQLNKKKSNISQIIGLNIIWLLIPFFLLIFFHSSDKVKIYLLYPSTKELSFYIWYSKPSLSIFIANAAKIWK